MTPRIRNRNFGNTLKAWWKNLDDEKGEIKNLQAFVTGLVFKKGGAMFLSPKVDSKFKEMNVREPQAKAIAGNIITNPFLKNQRLSLKIKTTNWKMLNLQFSH